MNTPKYIESYLSQPSGERAAVDVEFGVEPFPAGPIDSTIDALYGLLIHDDKTTLAVSQSPEAALGEYGAKAMQPKVVTTQVEKTEADTRLADAQA